MLDRHRLPDPVSYYRGQGFELKGRSLWRSERCPFHDDRHPSFRINTADGGFYCPGCDARGGDIIDFHMARFGLSFVDAVRDLGADDGQTRQNAPGSTIARAPVSRQPPKPDRAAEADSERKRVQAGAIWRAALPIAGTPVVEYLFGRTGTLPPADCTDIRHMPDLRLFGFGGSAMIGRISAANDAAVGIGLHLTWLNQDGGRWVRGERRYLGRKSGGAVRLWPDEAVTYSLAIAEGSRTIRSRTWLSASNHGPGSWLSLRLTNPPGAEADRPAGARVAPTATRSVPNGRRGQSPRHDADSRGSLAYA
jgi:hypothetical protein